MNARIHPVVLSSREMDIVLHALAELCANEERATRGGNNGASSMHGRAADEAHDLADRLRAT